MTSEVSSSSSSTSFQPSSSLESSDSESLGEFSFTGLSSLLEVAIVDQVGEKSNLGIIEKGK